MIYVTGTGRSGTSCVARVIHQNGIACMGHRFSRPDKHNPLGYWEDLTAKALLLNIEHMYAEDFLEAVAQEHGKAGCDAGRLGVKHPILVEMSKAKWVELAPEAVFLCKRSKEKVITSMMRKSGKVRRLAESFYVHRYNCIQRNLVGLPFVYIIDMDSMRTDEWILNQILMHL